MRESFAWFFAYIFLVALTGFFDYYLADAVPIGATRIPIRTSVLFFVLNFVAISSMVYLLLRFSMQEKQKIEAKLADAEAEIRRLRAKVNALLQLLAEPEPPQ